MHKHRILAALLATAALAGTAHAQSSPYINPQHNEHLALDVDNNGIISPQDLLLVINGLSQPMVSHTALPLLAGAEPLATTPSESFFFDTNGDHLFSAGDALVLVDHFATTPEPSSFVTAGIGLSLLAGYGWRRWRQRT